MVIIIHTYGKGLPGTCIYICILVYECVLQVECKGFCDSVKVLKTLTVESFREVSGEKLILNQ